MGLYEDILAEAHKKVATSDKFVDPYVQGDVAESVRKRNEVQPIGAYSDDSEFTKGVKRGAEGLKSTAYGAAGMIGSGLGIDAVRDWGYEGFQEHEAEAEKHAGRVQNIQDIRSIGDAGDWAAGTFGSLVPSIAEAGVTAAIGAGVGSAMAPGGGTIAGGVGGLVGKQAVKSMVRKLAKTYVKEGMEKQVAKTAAREAVESLPAKALARNLGTKAGIVAGTAPIEAGGMWGEGMQQGKDNPYSAAVLGTISGLTELVGGEAELIDIFTNPARQAIKGGLVKRMGVELGKTIPQEALQEATQESLSIINRKIADPAYDMLGEDARSRLLNSAAAGALGGVAFGGVGGAIGGKGRDQGAADRGQGEENLQPSALSPQPAPPEGMLEGGELRMTQEELEGIEGAEPIAGTREIVQPTDMDLGPQRPAPIGVANPIVAAAQAGGTLSRILVETGNDGGPQAIGTPPIGAIREPPLLNEAQAWAKNEVQTNKRFELNKQVGESQDSHKQRIVDSYQKSSTQQPVSAISPVTPITQVTSGPKYANTYMVHPETGKAITVKPEEMAERLKEGYRPWDAAIMKEGIPNGTSETRTELAQQDPNVRSMAANEGPMLQPQNKEFPELGRQRDNGLPGMEQQLPAISDGRGGKAGNGVLSRQNNRGQELRTGERSVGNIERTAEQQAQQPSSNFSRADVNGNGLGREFVHQRKYDGGENSERLVDRKSGDHSGQQKVFPPPVTPSARRSPAPNESILSAIGRLGGINHHLAQSEWGLDLRDMIRANRKNFGNQAKPTFRAKGGLTLDGMAEALAQEGWTDGRDMRGLGALIGDALRGKEVTNPQTTDYEAKAAKLEEEHYARLLEQAQVDGLTAEETDVATSMYDDLSAAGYLDMFSDLTTPEIEEALTEIIEEELNEAVTANYKEAEGTAAGIEKKGGEVNGKVSGEPATSNQQPATKSGEVKRDLSNVQQEGGEEQEKVSDLWKTDGTGPGNLAEENQPGGVVADLDTDHGGVKQESGKGGIGEGGKADDLQQGTAPQKAEVVPEPATSNQLPVTKTAPQFKGAAEYPGSPEMLEVGKEVRVTSTQAQEISDHFDKGRIHRLTHRDFFESGDDHGNPKYGHKFGFQSKPVRGITSFTINGDDLLISVKEEAAAGDGVLYAIRPEDIGGEFVVVRKSADSVFLYSNSHVDTDKAEIISHGLALKARDEELQKKAEGKVYVIEEEGEPAQEVKIDMKDKGLRQALKEIEWHPESSAAYEFAQGYFDQKNDAPYPENLIPSDEHTGKTVYPSGQVNPYLMGREASRTGTARDIRRNKAHAVYQEYYSGETGLEISPETGEKEPAKAEVLPEVSARKEKFNETRRKHLEAKLKTATDSKEKARLAKVLEGLKIEDFGEKIGGARKDTAERGQGKAKAKSASEEPSWKKRFIVGESVKTPGQFKIMDTKAGRYSFSSGDQTFASREEAEKAIPVYAVAKSHQLYQNSDSTWSIYKRVGERKRIKVVGQDFIEREDAMRYMVQNAERLLENKTAFGEEILPVPEIAVRKGAERRTAPATPEMFMGTFAPRGIEFGNWNNQEERQQVMDHAYDGLLDLAEVLDISPKALMLNGDLAIAFGARGQGLSGAKAHYERDYGVINLTKMKGAGSLAHEWFHALDHYMGRLDSKSSSEKEANSRGDQVYKTRGAEDYLSHGASYKTQLRPGVKEAYDRLIKTMYKKAEQYVEDTEKTENFVGKARENLKEALGKLRDNLSRDLAKDYTWRKSKRGLAPASAEQLSEFDRLSTILVEGGDLATSFRADNPKAPANTRAAFAGHNTNDTLEGISLIYKAVRNRTGFNAERTGTLDKLRSDMGLYDARLKMLRDAESQTEKTKQVPTSFAMEAKKMDQARAGDYWSEPHEMAARAFAAYVEDKVAESGGQSDFLVYRAHGGIIIPMIDGFVARPYPEGKEREALNAAFADFVKALETRETEKGTALYSRSPQEQSAIENNGLQGDAITDRPVSAIGGLSKEDVNSILEKESIKLVEVKGEYSDNLRQIAAAFGQKIAFYTPLSNGRDSGVRSDSERRIETEVSHNSNGFTINDPTAKVIFLNTKSKYQTAFVLGHEITHRFQRENEKEHYLLIKKLIDLTDAERFNYYLDKQSKIFPNEDDGYLANEFFANLIGERFLDKNFWEKMAGKEPSIFKKITDIALKVIQSVKNLFIDNPTATSVMADMNQAEKLIVDAMAKYARRNQQPAGKVQYALSPQGPFYSKLESVVESKFPGKADSRIALQMFEAWRKKGEFTADELEQSGIADFLADEKRVTKQDVLDFLKAQGTEFKDVVLGGQPEETLYEGPDTWGDSGQMTYSEWENTIPEKEVDAKRTGFHDWYMSDQREEDGLTWEEYRDELLDELTQAEIQDNTKFATYTEPGAKEGSYREMFVTAPGLKETLPSFAQWYAGVKDIYRNNGGEEFALTVYDKLGADKTTPSWHDGHSQYSDIHNPIVRIRFNEREADGKRILFIEEMQGPSDANQQKMPDYLRKRIYDIGVKRVLAYAKENGFNGVAWTPGEMQAKRYDLSKQVQSISWVTDNHDRRIVKITGNDGSVVGRLGVDAKTGVTESAEESMNDKPIDAIVGKEIGARILKDEDADLSGLDLKVGGEGLKRLYDQTLPALFKKYGKEASTELELKNIPHAKEITDDDGVKMTVQSTEPVTVPFIPITNQTPASYPRFAKNQQPATASSAKVAEVTAAGSDQRPGLNAEAVQTSLSPILKNWANAPKVEVVQSAADLPAGVHIQMARQAIDPSQVQAVFLQGTGGREQGADKNIPSASVILVAGNLENVQEAQRKLLHEVVGHYGLQGIMEKKEFERTMGEAALWYANKKNAEWKRMGETYGFDLKTREGRIAAAEELLAHEAESGAESSILDRIITTVRNALRKIGFTLEMSDAEIRELLGRARGFVERKSPQPPFGKGGYSVARGDLKAGGVSFALRDTAATAQDAFSKYIANFDSENIWKNLGRFLNPLDWSRMKKALEELTPQGLQDAVAHVVRVPFFAAQRDPNKLPFVEAGFKREEIKLDYMLKLLKWDGPAAAIPGFKERMKKAFTEWESSDRNTAWGRIIATANKLSPADSKGLALLVDRGDVEGKVYKTYDIVKADPKLAGVSEAAFKVYQQIRGHIDGPVADAIEQISRKFMHEAALPQDVIEKHISDYRQRLEKHKGWMPRNHGEGDHQVNVYHVINTLNFDVSMGRMSAEARLPYFPGQELAKKIKQTAKAQGLKYLQTANGHQVVTTDAKAYSRLTKAIRKIKARLLEKGLEQEEIDKLTAALGKNELTLAALRRDPRGQIDHFRKSYNEIFRKTNADRLMAINNMKEDIRQAKEDKESAVIIDRMENELAKLGDGRIRVKVYMRLKETKRRAAKHLAEVKRDLKSFIPENYIEGEYYQIGDPDPKNKNVFTTKFADQITEDMYGDMKNDFATEQVVSAAIERGKNRGDMSKEEAAEVRHNLYQTVAETLMARGSGAHQIRRAEYLIEGYDKDNPIDAYHNYMTGAAGMLSKARYAHDQFENFRYAPAEVKQWAYTYIKANLRNMGYADSVSGNLRAIASFMYLGFKVSSMVINGTQPWTWGIAVLAKYTKRSAVFAIGKAQKDILSGKIAINKGDTGITEDEELIFKSKLFKVQQMETAVHEMSGAMAGTTGKASQFFRTLTDKTLFFFQEVEILNRKTMILAAYRTLLADGTAQALAERNGKPLGNDQKKEIHETALKKAMDVNREVNFEMSRGNIPSWLQSHPLAGRLPYALQSFQLNSLNQIYNMLTSGEKEDMKALLRYAVAMAIIGGAAALPGWDELDKLYQRLFGSSPKLDLKKWTSAHAKEYGTFGELVNGFAWHGLASAGGVNISNAIRLQIPIVSPLLSGENLPEAAGGVMTGLIQKGSRAAVAASRGDVYKTVENLAPEAIAGAMRAGRMATQGATTASGKVIFDETGKQMKYTPGEAATRVLGFQPSRVSERGELVGTEKSLKAFWKEERDDLLAKLRISSRGEARRDVMRETGKRTCADH